MKGQPTRYRRPTLECLESRDLMAIYLPDSFSGGGATATSFNTGEQVFYRGASGELMFAFGNTTAARSYNGAGWNVVKVEDLVGSPLPNISGKPGVHQGVNPATGDPQLNVIYNAGSGRLMHVRGGPWEVTEIVPSGAGIAHVATFNGGIQVLYIGNDDHLHAILSDDHGQTWTDADLHDVVGISGNTSHDAVDGGGVAAVQIGSHESFIYRRNDHRLGVITWNGSAWHWGILGQGNDAVGQTVLGEYEEPAIFGQGHLASISYDHTGAQGTPNVGWIMYRGDDDTLRALWTVQPGIWRTAMLSSEYINHPPELAYDPVNRQLTVAYEDINRHIRLVQETAGAWVNRDLHSGIITNPLIRGHQEPNIYWRPALPGTPAGLHVMYVDLAEHILTLRVDSGNNHTLFDSTAFAEGYRRDFGYGMVNAARAVAYALNSSTALTGGSATGAWNLDSIGAPAAWTQATGVNTAVFVIDSGVDSNNNDMQTLAGRNTVAGNTDVTDANGHGTALAGIIAGNNDGQGITGVAHDADIVPIKVGDGGPASEQALVDAIDFALDYTLPVGYPYAARIINLAINTLQTSNPTTLLANLRNMMYSAWPTSVLVTSAGNRGRTSPDYPAAFNVGFGIIAGAVNQSLERWSPSNGASADNAPYNYLLAPGVAVESSTLVGSSGDDWNTAAITGTGAAAAHIAGVAALILDANPGLPVWDVENILIASADPITQVQSATPPSIGTTLYWA